MSLTIHFQDETILGLITEGGRKITLRGVKPIGIKQYIRKSYILYGAIAPLTGQGFFLELPKLNSECFQLFLKKFGRSHRDGLHILVLDQAKFHTAQILKCPSNIVLLFIPPKSPELNAIERFWQELKKKLKWKRFENLDDLKEEVKKNIESLA